MSQRAGSNVIELFKDAEIRTDSWFNSVTGLGVVGRDKVFDAFFQRSIRLSDQELEDLYNGDALAARMTGKIVEDALRQGYEIVVNVDDEAADTVSEANEIATAVVDALDALHATQKVREAWTWGRLFGGSALFVVTDEGADIPQDEPLELSRLRSVLALTVLDKRDLFPHSLYSDPVNPKFGQVETYMVNTSGSLASGSTVVTAVIHETRLIIFEGALTTNREKQLNNGWSLSVLQRPYDTLRQFNISWQAVSNLTQDAAQAVFKMDGLIEMLSGGMKDEVQTRMALVDRQRSVSRSLVIDAERETFERQAPALAGYPEVLELMMLKVSGDADMPVSVLFGQAPAGLNATGESDRLLWAQSVESGQELVADPAFTRLVELQFASREGPTGGKEPDAWDVVFPPLIHMTEEQEALIRKAIADTDVVYIDRGVLLPEEVAINRFKPTGFSAATTIKTAERELMLEEMLDPGTEPGTPLDILAAAGPAAGPVAQTALNGAQVSSLLSIVTAAAARLIPRDTAIEMITAAFPIDEAKAKKILSTVGAGFVPATQE